MKTSNSFAGSNARTTNNSNSDSIEALYRSLGQETVYNPSDSRCISFSRVTDTCGDIDLHLTNMAGGYLLRFRRPHLAQQRASLPLRRVLQQHGGAHRSPRGHCGPSKRLCRQAFRKGQARQASAQGLRIVQDTVDALCRLD